MTMVLVLTTGEKVPLTAKEYHRLQDRVLRSGGRLEGAMPLDDGGLISMTGWCACLPMDTAELAEPVSEPAEKQGGNIPETTADGLINLDISQVRKAFNEVTGQNYDRIKVDDLRSMLTDPPEKATKPELAMLVVGNAD